MMDLFSKHRLALQCSLARAALLVAVLGFVGGGGTVLHAALGARDITINTEQAQTRAQLHSFRLPSHMRYELTMPNGGAVHEFANASGQIFAVTWSGPGKPDLRTLLGPHFVRLQEASGVGRGGHVLRRPAQVNLADLQIQTGGHMGYFWGVAYLPALAPPGFSPSSLN